MGYVFNVNRFSVRGWAGQGGVVYDDADSTLYEVSDASCQLLMLLKQAYSSQTVWQLAQALVGDTPEDVDVQLVASVLADFEKMGVVTCQPA